MIEVKISGQPLDPASWLNRMGSPHSGGVNFFIGMVRRYSRGREVLRLEYEAYEPMALKEMQRIALQAEQRWQTEAVIILHRTGILLPGDIPVVIAVAAPHRDQSFEACRFLIESLKKQVPIWKKEYYPDGESWISPGP